MQSTQILANKIKNKQTNKQTKKTPKKSLTIIKSGRLHPRDAGIVQYMEIHQCNPLYKQIQMGEKHVVISLDGKKKF
jgi:PBP1b-binding outer membrane lipoprotein LpoB